MSSWFLSESSTSKKGGTTGSAPVPTGSTGEPGNELRRSSRRPPIEELDSQLEDPETSPLEAAIGRETVERYEAALARLKPGEREAIITRVELGLTFQEVAECLGKPSMDAARKTVVRALVRLAEEMEHQQE